MTIGDIPEDLLARSCGNARRVCDHPAKIVPFICKDSEYLVESRRSALNVAEKRFANIAAPRIEQHDKQYMTADDLAELKVEIGSKA